MRIDDILAGRGRDGEPVFSFEFFPPRTPDGERNLQRALDSLATLQPDFASVTYGAGGSTRDRTLDIVRDIKNRYGIEAMAHLSCVGATADELRGTLDKVRAAGIDNVLALRGDPPAGETEWRPHPGGLHYSTELAGSSPATTSVAIGAACFPEVHPEAPDMAHDLRFLREKVQAGASFLITQLFFDNQLYFDFVDEARAAGIDVPIIPGIIPITNADQIKRFTQRCGASIPRTCTRRSTGTPTSPTRSSSSASPTRPCSAPTCSRAAPPASTSTCSTRRRRPAPSSARCGCSARGSAPARAGLDG